MRISQILFALLRCEMVGTPLADEIKQAITPEVLKGLYKISKAHDLVHLVADALDKNGFLAETNELTKSYLRQRSLAVYRYEQSHYEFESLCVALEEAKIDYLPLKGSVLRNYYPEPWLRTSCDIDILVQKKDIEPAVAYLTEKLDYRLEGDHYHDMSLFSPGGVHLELHYELIEEIDSLAWRAVLANLWEELLPAKGFAYQKQMTTEEFYFYHMAHMAKHFIYGGCGIRPFIDVWIMENRMQYDKEAFSELLQRGGLTRFYEESRALVNSWFMDGEKTALLADMEEYVLQGGVYGTTENKISVNRRMSSSKFVYVMRCVFIPYGMLAEIYPSLEKHKWLLPFYHVRRWCRLIFRKGGPFKGVRHTMKAYDETSGKRKKRTAALLKNLKL